MRTQTWKGFLSGVAAATLVFSLAVPALAATARTLEATYSGIRITLDGRPVAPKDANGADVEPFAVDGTTYLPVRAVADALGLEVSWDQDTQTVALATPAQEAPAPGTPPPGDQYGRLNPVPVGTAHTFSYDAFDRGGAFTITMTVSESIRGEDAWKRLKEANMFNDPAPEGREYVLVRLSAKVEDSADKDAGMVFNLASFDLYSADSVEYTQFWTVVTPTPKFDGRVYAGGTLEGWLAFLVDQSDPAPKAVIGADYTGAGGAWFALTA